MCGSISIENCCKPHTLHLSGTAVSSAMPIETGLLVFHGNLFWCQGWITTWKLGTIVLVSHTGHFTKAKVEAQLEIPPLGSPWAWIHTGKCNSQGALHPHGHSVQCWPALITINALWSVLWRGNGRYFTLTDWVKLLHFCKPFPKVQ